MPDLDTITSPDGLRLHLRRWPAPDPQRARGTVQIVHGLGGLIAARFVAEAQSGASARWSRDVDGLVLSSPALNAGLGRTQRAMLAVLAPLLPNLRLHNGLKPEWISRNPAVVEDYSADPLVHDRVTPRLVRFIDDAGRAVLARARGWRVPTLLLWAGADRCVVPAGSRAFADLAPQRWVKAYEFPGMAHEIFNEPEREQVLQPLLQFLQQF